MRKAEIDLLYQIDTVDPANKLLNQPIKTVQQQFLFNYAAIHFIKGGVVLPSFGHAQIKLGDSGSISDMILSLKFMKRSIDSKKQIEDSTYGVIKMLMPWISSLQKIKKNKNSQIFSAILPYESGSLPVQHYEQLLVYFNYISKNIQSVVKLRTEFSVKDLFQILSVMLPRLHYNIILPQNVLGGQGKENKDVLFYNYSIQLFIRTQTRYRSLVRTILKAALNIQMRPTQARDLIDRAFQYYLLFYNDQRMHAAQLFLAIFDKAPEAVRFSLSDQLVLFLKIARKIGAGSLEEALTSKWEWIGVLMSKLTNSIVGQQKDEVNPFSPLVIQQRINVAAGKKVVRTIQIFHQFSLLYFWLTIQNHNIDMSLVYLGDFQSKVDVRKILAKQNLTDSVRSTFVATKRGIYQLQLDNSSSWINSKTINFQYVVLAQYQHKHNPIWLDKLLEIGEKGQVQDEIEQQQVNKSRQGLRSQNGDAVTSKDTIKYNSSTPQINMVSLKNQEAKANFTLINGLFDLHIASAHSTYEFDTTLEDRLLKRLKTYVDCKHLKWTVNDQAREWLHKQGLSLISKGSSTLLITDQSDREKKGKRLQKNQLT